MKAPTLFLTIATALLLVSCNNDDNGDKIARAFDNYLYESDIQGLVAPGTSPEDSATIVNNYIQQWIQEMVILEKAKNNISDDFEKELQNYKNSLITYNYERSIVEQQLDTNIADTTIQNYYNNNKSIFTLKHNILRAVYVKVPVKSKHIKSIRTILSSNELSDKKILELEKISANEAEAYNFDQNTWMTFFDFQHSIPVKTYNEEFYLKNTKDIYFTDNEYAYIAKILESKVTDEISPIDFEYQNIKNTILNARKVEIINNMRNNLRKKAETDKEIEIFKN